MGILEAAQLDEGPVRVGTRVRGVSKILGRRFEWTTEVTEFQPSTLSSSHAVEGKLRFTVTYAVSRENGGTRYNNRVEAETGLGGIFGRLADPIVEKAQRRTVRANLDTLAELLANPDALNGVSEPQDRAEARTSLPPGQCPPCLPNRIWYAVSSRVWPG